jgi:hypothetical protein
MQVLGSSKDKKVNSRTPQEWVKECRSVNSVLLTKRSWWCKLSKTELLPPTCWCATSKWTTYWVTKKPKTVSTLTPRTSVSTITLLFLIELILILFLLRFRCRRWRWVSSYPLHIYISQRIKGVLSNDWIELVFLPFPRKFSSIFTYSTHFSKSDFIDDYTCLNSKFIDWYVLEDSFGFPIISIH